MFLNWALISECSTIWATGKQGRHRRAHTVRILTQGFPILWSTYTSTIQQGRLNVLAIVLWRKHRSPNNNTAFLLIPRTVPGKGVRPARVLCLRIGCLCVELLLAVGKPAWISESPQWIKRYFHSLWLQIFTHKCLVANWQTALLSIKLSNHFWNWNFV